MIVQAGSELVLHTPEREISILRQRASTAGSIGQDVLTFLERTTVPRWAPTTVVHRDLYEEQILIDEQVGLIDLDDAALGPPELDVGNLLAHLDLFGLRQGQDLAAAARTAFLAGYADEGPALDDMLVADLRGLSWARLACIHDEPRLLAVD
jgi:Ser/Thr protein kinase RdoA (MazF antagonist)